MSKRRSGLANDRKAYRCGYCFDSPTPTPTYKPSYLLFTLFPTSNIAYGQTTTSSGFFLVKWWDGSTQVFPNGKWSKNRNPSSSTSTLFSIFSSDSKGLPAGDITSLIVQGTHYTDYLSTLSLSSIIDQAFTPTINPYSNNTLNFLLTRIDFSHATQLTTLSCDGHFFNDTLLDLSSLTLLTSLSCSYNYLTRLILPSSLSFLNCGFNTLTSIPLLPRLVTLVCNRNILTSLDLTSAKLLKTLVCENNILTSLLLPPSLTSLLCGFNPSLSISDVIQKTPLLTTLVCNSNRINDNTLDLRSFTQLNTLFCNDNNINSLLLPASLTALDCGTNPLDTQVVIQQTPLLTTLFCIDNSINSTLNFTSLTQLNTLFCSNNNYINPLLLPPSLTSLDCGNNSLDIQFTISQTPLLKKLICNNNGINGTLNLTSLTQLNTLFCNDNNIISLLLPASLTSLDCGTNPLDTQFVIQQTPLLTTLFCIDNGINGPLNLISLTQLNTLFCNDNNIISLLLPGSLTSLGCGTNSFLIIEDAIQQTPLLKTLSCGFNSINGTLDLTSLTQLNTLICNDNNINSLFLPGSLTSLGCGNNSLDIQDVIQQTPYLNNLFLGGNTINSKLDVTSFTLLTLLYCVNNSSLGTLTLPTSAPNLTQLFCQNDYLDVNALNAIFNAVNNTPTPPDKNMYIAGNPGTTSSDITIATNKGWTVSQ